MIVIFIFSGHLSFTFFPVRNFVRCISLGNVQGLITHPVCFILKHIFFILFILEREKYSNLQLLINIICSPDPIRGTAPMWPWCSAFFYLLYRDLFTVNPYLRALGSSNGGKFYNFTSKSLFNPGPIRATAPMWRCSKIMHMQRDLHPTVLSSLEGIVDQECKIIEEKFQKTSFQ